MYFVFGMLCLCVSVLIFIYFKISHSYWKDRGVPQLAPSFPFGNARKVITRRQSVADKVLEIYEELKPLGHKYAGLYFFSRKVFLPMDPCLVKNILGADFQYFHDRGIYYDEKNDPVSAHLFSLTGSKWKHLRAKLTPAFTGGKVKYMFQSVLTCAEEMVEIISAELFYGETIEMKDFLARFTTDVIGSCAFGLECNSLKNPRAEFRLMGKRAFTQTPIDALKMIIIRSFPSVARFLQLGVFAGSVSKFFKKVVEDTIEYRERNNITRKDFLQLLIQLKNKGKLEDDPRNERDHCDKPLSTDEVAAQAFIFFLAGFETTSTAMSFALVEMALNMEIQEKARAEVLNVLKKHENKVCYEAVGELHYVEKVVLESMRKYPPAPVFLRKCTKDYKIPETNVIIEKGLSVLIPVIALQRDPEYFPAPDVFDPERFSEENKHRIRDHTYLPFGDGPRICIGLRFAMVQAKLSMLMLLKHFKFTLNEKTCWPLKMETKGIILSPIGGVWLNMQKLDN